MARLKMRKWHFGINCLIIVTSNFESTFFGKGKSIDFRKVVSTLQPLLLRLICPRLYLSFYGFGSSPT